MKKTLSIMTVLAVCIACVFMLPFGRMSAQAAKAGLSTNKAQLLIDDPVAPGSSLTLSSYSGTYGPETFSGSFKVYCSTGWTVSASASWFHLGRTSGSGNGTVSISLDPNFTGSTRTGTITVRSTGTTVSSKVYKITQTSLPNKLTLSKFSEDVDYQSRRVTITVKSPYSWTAKKNYNDRTWARLETTSGLAGTTTAKILIDQNTTTSYRSCPITFTASNGTTAYYVLYQAPYTEDAPNIEIGFPGQNGQMEDKTVFSGLKATGMYEHVVEVDCNKRCYRDSIQIIHFTFACSHNTEPTQYLEVEKPYYHQVGEGKCASSSDHTVKCYSKYSGHDENGAWGVQPVLTIDAGYYTYKIRFTNMQKTPGPKKWSHWKDSHEGGNQGGSNSGGGSGNNDPENPYYTNYWRCPKCQRWNMNQYSFCTCGEAKPKK